jgi:hypothetical protein
MVDIHVQVEICTAGGEWGYILWDRLGPSMHGGYPCTAGGEWGYILWDRLGPSMHVFCTVLYYYDYSQYILPSNVYVQFSLITIIANTSCPGTFMYITIIANTSFPVTFMCSSLLLHAAWQAGPCDPSQERLCTVLSYYDYSQYILPRNVYVHYDYSLYILLRNVYVHYSPLF